MQLRWVLEASAHYPGNHGIHGSADCNLERIRRLFGNLLSFTWRWSVDLAFASFTVEGISYNKKRENAV